MNDGFSRLCAAAYLLRIRKPFIGFPVCRAAGAYSARKIGIASMHFTCTKKSARGKSDASAHAHRSGGSRVLIARALWLRHGGSGGRSLLAELEQVHELVSVVEQADLVAGDARGDKVEEQDGRDTHHQAV